MISEGVNVHIADYYYGYSLFHDQHTKIFSLHREVRTLCIFYYAYNDKWLGDNTSYYYFVYITMHMFAKIVSLCFDITYLRNVLSRIYKK